MSTISIPGFSIHIDHRETTLQKYLKETLEFESRNLIIGDIVFYKEDELSFLIERKTLADLAASIKDGRFRDQSKRILECVTPNRCCYLIEGSVPIGTTKIGGLPVSTLYSSLLNKTFRDGCVVYRTRDVADTAAFLLEFAKKFKTMEEYFTKPTTPQLGPGDQILPLMNTVPRKKGDITMEQCYLAQLCQIPGISIKKAQILLDVHPSMKELILAVTKQGDGVSYLTGLTGKGTRKLGKASSKSVHAFLGLQ